jgi:prolyl-tRNA synthetase
MGANESGFHYRNANNSRDFTINHSADIALARSGDGCPECDSHLEALRGIEVGHVFKLGTSYSERLGAIFLSDLDRQQPCFMGCYGIGVTRVLAAAIEQNHDEKGIIFPPPIAPYQIHLVTLNSNEDAVKQAADALYADLNSRGFEVLYDDRVESAGVKFNDVDLLGLPIRLVMSSRTLASGGLEVKLRKQHETERIPLEELLGKLNSILA